MSPIITSTHLDNFSSLKNGNGAICTNQAKKSKMSILKTFLPLKRTFFYGKYLIFQNELHLILIFIILSCFLILRFESLSPVDKIAVTTISNTKFTESFIKMLPQRSTNRVFNLNSEKWINSIDAE